MFSTSLSAVNRPSGATAAPGVIDAALRVQGKNSSRSVYLSRLVRVSSISSPFETLVAGS
ncbi:hypothetical protein D3C73_910920 [compost metagenome]